MRNNLQKTTIALAGMMQAVSLVRDLAQTGKTDETAFKASIGSIFQREPEDITSVYGGLEGIKVGLEKLIRILNGEPALGRPLMHYVISLIHLQKKIDRSPKVLDHLKLRISQIQKQVDYFSLLHPTVISNLADTYLNTISTFRFRIMVWGNPRILNTPEAMEKIRALLLAGIRSAVLWRQAGGSRLQLLFSRTKIKAMAKEILSRLDNQSEHEKEGL